MILATTGCLTPKPGDPAARLAAILQETRSALREVIDPRLLDYQLSIRNLAVDGALWDPVVTLLSLLSWLDAVDGCVDSKHWCTCVPLHVSLQFPTGLWLSTA